MDEVHVYPIGDLVQHELDGVDCPCLPRVENVEGSLLVIHNSWDGREVMEANIERSD